MSSNTPSSQRSLPFGRYLLLEEIAQGGMARVYRAVLREASGFEKTVALKRILRELGEDPEFVTRFTDEARIVSTLSHSNIAQVFDFGQVDGEYYLAMELVDGPDLGTLLEACDKHEQPVPIPTALFIAAEMARGLGAAHRRKDERGQRAPIVHRDVSPQNLLLSRSGEVKLVDFGIAKAADKALRTRTGLVMGKCHYMAPEQATGRPVDPRADIFSAGCVIHQLLTGASPFSGRHAKDVLSQVISAPIDAPSVKNPEVPPEVDEIVGKCLDREIVGRYPDGSALARDLEALLHRITPDFSRDDLAQFIETIVPAKRRPAAWEAARTRQVGNEGPPGLDAYEADPALADTVASSQPAALQPDGGLSDPAPAREEPLSETDPAHGPSRPSVAGPGAAHRVTAPARESRPIQDPAETLEVTRATQLEDRRAGLLVPVLLAAAVLLGAGVGLAATWFTSAPPLPPGRTVERDGWRLAVTRLERPPQTGLLVMRLALRRIDDELVEGAPARLSLCSPPGAPARPPRFWTRDERGLLVAFRLSDRSGVQSDRHRLIFAPPTSSPLTLELQEQAEP